MVACWIWLADEGAAPGLKIVLVEVEEHLVVLRMEEERTDLLVDRSYSFDMATLVEVVWLALPLLPAALAQSTLRSATEVLQGRFDEG